MNTESENSPNSEINKKKETSEGLWRGIALPIIQALIIVVIIRTFIAQPFVIPSASMQGTLLVGDNIFATKYSYGYSRYSFPVDFLFEDRVFFSEPERGDVIVFRLPRDPSIDYIKRLVGLPGDTVQVKQGVLFINGKKIIRKKVENFVDDVPNTLFKSVPQYQETLPNGKQYSVLEALQNSPTDNTRVYRVPEGEYFFMGDNRDNSKDSRYAWDIGTVKAENLVGKAQFIFFSIKSNASFWEFWKWYSSIRFSRIFKKIK